jgi:hypothetical protein
VNIYVLDENEKCKIKTKKTPTTHANNNDGKTDVGSWREKQKKNRQSSVRVKDTLWKWGRGAD